MPEVCAVNIRGARGRPGAEAEARRRRRPRKAPSGTVFRPRRAPRKEHRPSRATDRRSRAARVQGPIGRRDARGIRASSTGPTMQWRRGIRRVEATPRAVRGDHSGWARGGRGTTLSNSCRTPRVRLEAFPSTAAYRSFHPVRKSRSWKKRKAVRQVTPRSLHTSGTWRLARMRLGFDVSVVTTRRTSGSASA